MFTDGNHIIRCLMNRYNYKVLFKRKQADRHAHTHTHTHTHTYIHTCIYVHGHVSTVGTNRNQIDFEN